MPRGWEGGGAEGGEEGSQSFQFVLRTRGSSKKGLEGWGGEKFWLGLRR